MKSDQARAAVLDRLRAAGCVSAADLLALCDGRADLTAHVRQSLVLDEEATADGDGLRFTGTRPDPAARDEPETDLFISYAHADDTGGVVRALVERVRTLQLDFEPRAPVVFYDRFDIRGFHKWDQRILDKLRQAKAMLIVLSPNYFASEYCRKEWDVFHARERKLSHSDGAILNLYAVEIPGFEFDPRLVSDDWKRDLAGRNWTDLRGLWRLGPSFLDADDAPPYVESLRQDLTSLVKRGTRVLSSRSTVPEPSEHFVGRRRDLDDLRTRLLDERVGSIVAAQGLGGMGKSALAFAYAQDFAADYPGGRYLVAAEGQSDLRAAVLSLASTLGVEFSPEESREPERALAKVHAALTKAGPALLVLDNVSAPDLLTPHQIARAIPPTDVHALATTRLTPDELHLPDAACQEVKALPEDDAVRLLDAYRPFAGEPDPAAAEAAAHDIARWLGGYVLAVEVVAVYLWKHREKGVTYPDYRDRLEREGFAGLEATGDDAAVALSLHAEKRLSVLLGDTLDGLGDAERAVLEFAAVLPPEAVVWPWLRTLVGQAHTGLVPEAVPGYPDPWRTIQDRLRGLRLLTPAEQDEAGVERISRMHRLVREVVRQRMADRLDATDAATHAYVLERAQALYGDGWHAHDVRWELEPLAETAAWLAADDDLRAAALATWVQDSLRQLGRYPEARRLLEDAIRIVHLHHVENHPDLAVAYSNLAMVVQDQGDLVKARRLFENAIRILRLHHGDDHLLLATFSSNLASVACDEGDLVEAQRLLEDAIRIERLHVHPDHLTFATHFSTLAAVMRNQGDLVGARRLLEDAVRIQRLHHGNDHPILAVITSNLATIMQGQGDLVEARRLLEDAVRIQRLHFHPNHPTFATRYSNLAMVVRDQGNLAEARRLLEDAVRIQRLRHGNDHPNLAVITSNLAMIMQGQGDLVEARRLLEDSIRIERLHFHPDHPTLATSYSNLGFVLWESGEHEEAARLMKTAFAIFLHRLGPEHPNVNVAWDYLHEYDPVWVEGVKAGRVDPLKFLPRAS